MNRTTEGSSVSETTVSDAKSYYAEELYADDNGASCCPVHERKRVYLAEDYERLAFEHQAALLANGMLQRRLSSPRFLSPKECACTWDANGDAVVTMCDAHKEACTRLSSPPATPAEKAVGLTDEEREALAAARYVLHVYGNDGGQRHADVLRRLSQRAEAAGRDDMAAIRAVLSKAGPITSECGPNTTGGWVKAWMPTRDGVQDLHALLARRFDLLPAAASTREPPHCPTCGCGMQPAPSTAPCETCGGRRKAMKPTKYDNEGLIYREVDCPDCTAAQPAERCVCGMGNASAGFHVPACPMSIQIAEKSPQEPQR